jgi:rod shape determining protein RodA
MIRKWLKRLTAHFDSFLMGVLLLTMLVGLFVLYSASGMSLEKTGAQVVNILVALGCLWAFANLPPQHLERVAVPLYILGMLLLIGVALFGDVSHGAKRWLNLGVTRIQPSE